VPPSADESRSAVLKWQHTVDKDHRGQERIRYTKRPWPGHTLTISITGKMIVLLRVELVPGASITLNLEANKTLSTMKEAADAAYDKLITLQKMYA
jgi:hypothetical protein